MKQSLRISITIALAATLLGGCQETAVEETAEEVGDMVVTPRGVLDEDSVETANGLVDADVLERRTDAAEEAADRWEQRTDILDSAVSGPPGSPAERRADAQEEAADRQEARADAAEARADLLDR